MSIKYSPENETKKQLKEYFLVKKDEHGKVLKPQTKKGIFEIAKHITDEFHCLALGEFKRDIFIYNDAVYKLATNQLKAYTQDILEECYSTGFFNEIIEQVKNRCTKDRREIEENNNNLINLKNGILDIETLEMSKHDPKKYYFFNKIPVIFEENAACPQIDKVMNSILAPTDVDLIQELFGFCLYRQYFIKKAFIFTGVKNTGKTTILKLLGSLIGSDNISGVSLQDLGVRHFALSDLYNKYVNVYDDMSSKDVSDTGKFKMVTGQSPIVGEYKFGARFPFVNYAKLIFACNRIPAVNDVDDEAYFDRWVIVNFSNVIDKKEVDPFLIKKITTEEELSGLFNFALNGLKRLIRQKWFSYNKTPEEIKQEMLKNSNPIASFVYNCLVKTDEENFSYVKKDEMYRHYEDFCSKKGLGVETDDKFYKDINKYAGWLRTYRPNTGENPRPYCYSGVRIINND